MLVGPQVKLKLFPGRYGAPPEVIADIDSVDQQHMKYFYCLWSQCASAFM
jgi:hypothetical protein